MQSSKTLFADPQDVFTKPTRSRDEVLNKLHEYKLLEQLPDDTEDWYRDFLRYLTRGEIRTASKLDGVWTTDSRVKEGILLGFRLGVMAALAGGFVDKHTLPLRPNEEGVRIVPGGTAVRAGTYLGQKVVIMPPTYVNIGAYVGEGTLLDSGSLVGSCAQIGANCHISGGAMIGGVLEPINKTPCIVEDNVFMGLHSSISEGVIVSEGAVLGAGVQITASTPVYDLVREQIYTAKEDPLIIPPRAIVVPGSRQKTESDFAIKHGLSIATPVIVKYRDAKTDAVTALENALR